MITIAPILKNQHQFGVDIDHVVQIVVDTDTLTVTEEIGHIPVATQSMASWEMWMTKTWESMCSCFRYHDVQEEEEEQKELGQKETGQEQKGQKEHKD